MTWYIFYKMIKCKIILHFILYYIIISNIVLLITYINVCSLKMEVYGMRRFKIIKI